MEGDGAAECKRDIAAGCLFVLSGWRPACAEQAGARGRLPVDLSCGTYTFTATLKQQPLHLADTTR
jgi:hypothetical protein